MISDGTMGSLYRGRGAHRYPDAPFASHLITEEAAQPARRLFAQADWQGQLIVSDQARSMPFRDFGAASEKKTRMNAAFKCETLPHLPAGSKPGSLSSQVSDFRTRFTMGLDCIRAPRQFTANYFTAAGARFSLVPPAQAVAGLSPRQGVSIGKDSRHIMSH